ncbi:Z protein [Mammarenavirus praomyidis]|uniref:RING finger protein Z n=1 Tax=Mobala mammarenavirus (isolate Rat/Central African Republic/Acar 3080/1983) TaxID=3052325 RepID=Z_MOBVC|nr:Z protein [Mammarenavirus praomyidis]Q27YE6.1 RecName: Full=RING finger protein Z; Short=Protein Z; AltName: Full=Zinc-binding protein [Mammarenavirus praomyidis]ABC71138.1 Z protein [Mammarenavirus praomyidis]
MGQKPSKPKAPPTTYESPRSSLTPDATGFGPEFCKSCWFERKGLIKCQNHYLCMTCLTLLLTVSNRCPVCKYPLPTKLRLEKSPTAPPPEATNPPPYSP